MTQFAIPYYSNYSNAGDVLWLRTRFGGTWSSWHQILTENASGNVGIGTTAPVAKLDVNGMGQFGGGTQIGGGAVQGYYGDTGNLALRAYNSASSDIYFQTYAGASTNMIIKNNGNVGIGVVAPSGKLHVAGDIWGSSSDLVNRYFWQRGGAADIWVRLYTAAAAYQNLAVGGFYAGGAVRFDLAEVTPVRPEEDLEPGDVVSIDKEAKVGLRRSQTAYDTLVAGIVSDPNTASMVIGGDTPPEKIGIIKDKKPIALVGRVLCKVSIENGPIEAWDLLVTSSIPGHAMKADLNKLKPGMMVGKALEPGSAESAKIMVWVVQG